MTTILVSFTAVIVPFVIFLAVIQVGIWQQERAGSLDQCPRGLCAAISRRVLGLYVRRPERVADRPAGSGRGIE